jgi:hypothetical protein
MALRITVDVFSGRPNPVLELDGLEAEEALARLRPVRKLGPGDPRPLSESRLGYRGLLIEQTGPPSQGLPKYFRVANGELLGHHLSHRPADEHFEEFVCGPTGLIRRLPLGPRFAEFFAREREELRESRSGRRAGRIRWPAKLRCRCAPLYEPSWWNDGGQKQLNNNCYNYATDYRTDSFAQPGLAAGAMYTALTCAAVRPAAVADDLLDRPAARNRCPKEGHLVALVVAPGWDFHWYRKGRNGLWTHKPGGTPVTNLDNSGVTIPDPRTANRGPYTDFCTFMVVMHGHIKIR